MGNKSSGGGYDAIRAAYVTGSDSLEELAKKHHVSQRALYATSREEGWVKQRREYRRNVADKAIRKQSAKDIQRLARLKTAALKLSEKVVKAIDDSGDLNTYLVEHKEEYAEPDDQGRVSRSYTAEETFSKPDTKALRELVGAVKDLTGVMRNLYGLPTAEAAESQALAREKFALEKQKLQREIDAGKPEDVEVILRIPEGIEDENA